MLAHIRPTSLYYPGNVVTSFPRKWTKLNGDHVDDILERLLHHLRSDKMRRPIQSGYDLAQLIIKYCTNVFDRSTNSTQLPLRELFECSIGAVVGIITQFLNIFAKRLVGSLRSRTTTNFQSRLRSKRC